MKYPIGVQSFSEIRTKGFAYVDKTALVHKLVTGGKYLFLSRPRRFGKSLLLSTIEMLFSGRKELFEGLAINDLGWDWTVHPVLHIDLNVADYSDDLALYDRLDATLQIWEKQYGLTPTNTRPEIRLDAIIRKAYEITGQQVVILIDEYDKPLVRTLHNPELQEVYRNQLQAFYGVLKSLDQYIRFAMLTGVTRFSKVNVFSGLNNLNDISLEYAYNAICGITDAEIDQYFKSGVEMFDEVQKMSYDAARETLRLNYDGYHFCNGGAGIYNPFSLLTSLSNTRLGAYWAETGTPTFLVDLLKKEHYPLPNLEGVSRTEQDLKGSDAFNTDLVPMFFQTGYLTIKGYNEITEEYVLGYPNREVKKSFLSFLVPFISPKIPTGSKITDLVKAVMNGETEKFMTWLEAFFADFPYEQIPDMEVHYQNVIYVIMKLMGFYVRTEYRTSQGRVDMVIQTDKYIYVIEFKLGGSPKTALKQIEENGYAKPFEGQGKTIIRLGVVFDKTTRALKKWAEA
ncbi:MAG: ATP-binding protein [Bacteroides sp.]|nr:ATP-binding protein [Bacteroides sp.]MCM1379261.1 ATP-binding protein [Bacteroides sp.]MCM1445081.1 ATP-binding protein [Prevotella sp.]